MFLPRSVRGNTTEIDESRKDGSSPSEEEEEDIVVHSVDQRWPAEGEAVCVVCGRYGAYIVDQTDKDVCSLECKEKHLQRLSKRSKEMEDIVETKRTKTDSELSSDQIQQIYKEVNRLLLTMLKWFNLLVTIKR